MQRIDRGRGISRKTAVCKFPEQGCLRSGTFIIVPVLKEMNFAPFGGPLQSFVCSLVPSDDLNESLKPLQHNEREKKIESLISRKRRPSM